MPNRAQDPKGQAHPQPSPFASKESRRQAVTDLWVRNTPVRRIATMLGVPHRTVRSDIAVLRKELEKGRVVDIEARRDRTLAELRAVLLECWSRLARTKDVSNNVSGLLNTIVTTEKLIAQLEGTLSTGMQITQTTTVQGMPPEEWQRIQETIAAALMPFSEARVAVASALARMETNDRLN
jgi:hypothetical protein